MAGDVIKVLQVYSKGNKTAIPLTDIDSLKHSRYDADSILSNIYSTAVVYALDSTYQIPINDIDSLRIEDVDIDEYMECAESIRQYLFSQKEQPVEQFQQKLMEWLNKCEFVNHVSINESKDFIIVRLNNGMDFCLSFRDLSSDEFIETGDAARVMKTSSEKDEKYFNVTSTGDDTKNIIEPAILYFRARKSMSLVAAIDSYAETEWEELNNLQYLSPVNVTIKPIIGGYEFFEEDFSKYGLIIISLTHGDNDRSGMFQISDTKLYWKYLKSGILGVEILSEKGLIKYRAGLFDDYPWLFWVKPQFFASKILNKNCLIHGYYCYSIDLTKTISNATVFGYDSNLYYKPTKDYPKDSLIKHTRKLLHGLPFNQAISFKPYTEFGLEHKPTTNHLESRQRFFSISLNDIKFDPKDGVIVTGKIYGAKNLSVSTLSIYKHEGETAITPDIFDSCDEKWCLINKETGEFTAKYDNSDFDLDSKYSFTASFEYIGRYYYCDSKYFILKSSCPDKNHPHAIDLGLPSGTKWACCNLGASTPEECGDHFAWGETSKKNVYNWDTYEFVGFEARNRLGTNISGTSHDAAKAIWGDSWRMPTKEQFEELKNYCEESNNYIPGTTTENGQRYIGPNGNIIFFTGGTGYRWDETLWSDDRDWSYYWTATSYDDQIASTAYGYRSNFIGLNSYVNERYEGLAIRPVCP